MAIDLWPARGKNSVRNLQYEPKTRLIRGIYTTIPRRGGELSTSKYIPKREASWYISSAMNRP